MPDELKAQMARAFVVTLSPIFLILSAWWGWKVWRWFRRMSGG